MQKRQYYGPTLLLACFFAGTILFFTAGCAGCGKGGNGEYDLIPVATQKTGTVQGYISPTDAKAVVYISHGFYYGRELLFEDIVEADPATGRYVIHDVPQGTFMMEAIPANSDYQTVEKEGVQVESDCTTWVNYLLPKN